MAHGFIGQNEVIRLRQGTDECHALLLSERHVPYPLEHLVGNTQPLEPAKYLLVGGKAREAVLDLHVLPRGKFGKEAKFLKQIADVMLADVGPLLHAECLHITPIKEQAARVVMPMADEIAAESALAHAAVGLDEVFLSFLQCQRLLPNFRMEVGNLCKYVREKTV